MATTVEQVTAKANELGYGWVISNQEYRGETFDDAREMARAILQSVDANQAPGSETSLRTDANHESARCSDDDLIGTLDWFLRAYTAQEKLNDGDADEGTREQFYEYLFSGSLEAAEEMVAA